MARILVVEDEQVTLLFFKRTLESAGYEVREAHNGLEALAELKKAPVDLIISDIMMPRMTGGEFLFEARHDGLVQCPVIVVTAYLPEERADVSIGVEGAAALLDKPITSDKLLDCVHGVLEGSWTSGTSSRR